MVAIDDILDPSNLKEALENLVGRKDSCGIDNIRVSEFPIYWEINSTVITDKIRNGTYEPDIVLDREIVGYNGKHRRISQLTCTDRLLLRAVNQIIYPVGERYFTDACHAYRVGYGAETAVRSAADFIANGNTWVAEIDIEHFFDTIPMMNHISHISTSTNSFLPKSVGLLEEYGKLKK